MITSIDKNNNNNQGFIKVLAIFLNIF